MSTRHLIDPEILPVLDVMPSLDLTAGTLGQVRARLSAMQANLPPPALVPQTHMVKGRDGTPDVRLLLFDPPSKNRNRGAILHIHGGGMVIGSADMSLSTMPTIALMHDVVVVSVDYRLAPETPFPGPQEDCYASLDWLVANAATLGVDVSRIIVMGESAGGGLAAALALMVRDRAEHKLAGQVLVYPMLDHRTGSKDCPYQNPMTGEFVWTRNSNQFGWNSLQGDYALNDAHIGWFSPSRAADLAGLPPVFINVGTLDLFFDEDLDYARRLVAAGVAVEAHIYPGAFHGYDVMPGTRLAKQSAQDITAAVARLTMASVF